MTTRYPVRFEVRDSVGHLVLDRPESSNAIDPAFIAGFAAALDEIESSDIRALLVTANGPNFCVGADLKYLAQCEDIQPAIARLAAGFHAALARLCALPVPIVAATQGHSVGGGWGLALAADILVASDDARYATGYVKIGLSVDAGVSFFLLRAVGTRLARSLLMTSRFLPASEAMALGLVDQRVPKDDLASAVGELGRQLAAASPAALAAIKRLTVYESSIEALKAHLDREEKDLVALAGSEPFRSSLQAFVEKSR